jgi:hypothetical protein
MVANPPKTVYLTKRMQFTFLNDCAQAQIILQCEKLSSQH